MKTEAQFYGWYYDETDCIPNEVRPLYTRFCVVRNIILEMSQDRDTSKLERSKAQLVRIMTQLFRRLIKLYTSDAKFSKSSIVDMIVFMKIILVPVIDMPLEGLKDQIDVITKRSVK